MSIWQINRVVHAVADCAGCSPDRLFGSHSLRKSFAQRVHAACGRDINLTRVALGHSCVSVTQRYLRVDQSDVDAAILALDTACVA
jgi:integrase